MPNEQPGANSGGGKLKAGGQSANPGKDNQAGGKGQIQQGNSGEAAEKVKTGKESKKSSLGKVIEAPNSGSGQVNLTKKPWSQGGANSNSAIKNQGQDKERSSLVADFRAQKEQDPQLVSEKQDKESGVPWVGILMGLLILLAIPAGVVWACFNRWPGASERLPGEFKSKVDQVVMESPIPKPAGAVIAVGLENLLKQTGWSWEGELMTSGWEMNFSGDEFRDINPRSNFQWTIRQNGGENLTNELAGTWQGSGSLARVRINQGGQLPITKITNWQVYAEREIRIPLLRDGEEITTPGQLGLLRVRAGKLNQLNEDYSEILAQRAKPAGSDNAWGSGGSDYYSYLTADEYTNYGKEWLSIWEEGQDQPWIEDAMARKLWAKVAERWPYLRVKMQVQPQPVVVTTMEWELVEKKPSYRSETELDIADERRYPTQVRLSMKFSDLGGGMVEKENSQSNREALVIPVNKLINWERLAEWVGKE